MNIEYIKVGNGILDQIVQNYYIINNMWIEKVDDKRYKIKINTSLGEQTKIVHRNQLYWLSDEELNDICNKQQILKFD